MRTADRVPTMRVLAVVAALLSLAAASCAADDPADTAAPSESTQTTTASTSPDEPSTGEPTETDDESESTTTTATAEPVPDRPDGVPAAAQAALVTAITDGDTLTLRARRPGPVLRNMAPVSVRLLEVDTPETVDPSEPVQCYGPAATQALTRFAPPGSQVWALPDVERTDQYDRVLLYLWRVVDGETLFINRALVINGFAIAALYEPNDAYIDVMRDGRKPGPRQQSWPLEGMRPLRSAPHPTNNRTTLRRRGGGDCDPNYVGACIPPYPPDLDCTEISATGFQSVGTDPHGFDADGDGIACDT